MGGVRGVGPQNHDVTVCGISNATVQILCRADAKSLFSLLRRPHDGSGSQLTKTHSKPPVNPVKTNPCVVARLFWFRFRIGLNTG